MLDEVLNQPATEVGPTVTQEGGTSESGPTVTSVAKDIGHGIIEAPVQTFGGVSDAARETFEALGSVADWFEENIGGTLPGTGIEAIDRPLDALAKLMPDIDAADSVTGNLFRKTSQFIAGFLGAGKFIKAKGVVGAMTKGAAADAVVMDPHEDRLSNLVQEYPALKNPVSDFLSARPTDTEALGRFKNAVEGLGLGAVADGFMLSLKAIRAGRKVKAAAQEPEAPSLLPEEAKQVFDPDGPRTTTKDGRIYINMARIDSTDDIKVLMQEMADRKYADIDKARRGKRTHGETEAAADTIDAFDVLLNKRSADPSVTKPLTAEETVAARRLWTASAEQLMDIAEAASKNPSEVNLVGFRKAMAAHDAISKEVLAVRAETARALDSWKIPAGGGKEQMRHLQNALDMHGGADVSRELATRIAAMRGADLGDLDDVVRGTVGARTRDAVIEGWVMGLLSGPKTHLVNTMSNTSVLFQQIGERAVAARLGRVLGTDGGVQVGEAMAQTFGMLQGLKDAFRFVGRSFRTGKSGFGVGKVGLPRQGAISSESFNIASDTWIGRVVDFLGTAVRIPGRALGAEDEFFKTLGYRMELNARALRQASEEVHAGKVEPDKLKERIADLLENPPEDLRLAATDAALYQTFTNRTGAFADSLRKMADADPSGFSRVLLSFIRTPSNIMKFTFERTPLAPLMSQVRAGMAAGGARKDLALARMATGSAMMLAAADLTMSGAITGKGPDNPSRRSAKQRQGWQPYSVKIGDRYFAFNRMDPIGMTLGLAADAVEILQNSDGSKPKAAEEAIIAAVASIANNMTSKTYLRGASQFFKMMSNPTRFSESYVQRLLRTAIPTAAAEVARGVDPYLRETRSIMDSLRRRTPGISKELPAVRDLWGAPIEFRSGLGWAYDAVSPIYSRREKASPIDKEILRLGMNITKPPRVISIDGITVDLDKHKGAYSRYVELAGNELKHPAWGIGAKDYLDALIKGQHPLAEVYKMRSDGPDGSKADMVRATVLDYRAHARRQLLEEYPSISAEISAARMDRLHQVHQVQ